ncbi:Ig domain-containing protein [Nocardioides flavescens]|uniref:Uncharacterized protein n=1 Tax=Nocardioides flavescens TaxID=2691959 RepID=A0A6L7EVM4_9ACTN|nr:Ig domain-containing protein [Nocardioides flavescens]MXG91453.1 hypothetical protein [Nocardioides flavescens]
MPSRRPRALAGLLSAALAAASIAFVGGAAPAAAADAPCTKNAAGDCVVVLRPSGDSTRTFVVPTGVTSLTADVWGAGGSWIKDGAFNVRGGYGGRVKASFGVVPGETVYVLPGLRGPDRTSGRSTTGGGGSFVFYGEGTEIAAGGGGGAYRRTESDTGYTGGAGGGVGAGKGATDGGGVDGPGGAAASADAPGGRGSGPARRTAGGIVPGAGEWSDYGSGGDGWFGGGATTESGAGGGGSGHLAGATLIESTAGFNSSDGSVTLTWTAGPAVTTSTLPNATYGSTYSAQLAASGGTAPNTWSLVSGPSWLSLSSDGELSGVPTSATTGQTVSVKAVDAQGVSTATSYLQLVVDKAKPALSFTSTPPDPAKVGGSYTPAVTSSMASTSRIILSTTGSGCSWNDAQQAVVLAKVGVCTVRAFQPEGPDTTSAAAEQIFSVAKGAQTITFTSTPPSAARIGGSYTPTATSPAGTVSFTASGACAKQLGDVEMTSTGTCTVSADQAGSDDYDAAPTATQTFTVGKALQTVSIDSAAPTTAQVAGASYTVSIKTSTENPVSVVVDPSTTNAACSVSSRTVTFQHAGTCALQAVAAGSARYEQATSPVQSFTVAKGSFSPDWTVPNGLVVGDSWVPQVIGVPAGAGAPTVVVDSKASDGACVVSPTAAGTVVMRHAGRCVVRVDYAPSADWNASTAGPISFTVGKAAQTITWAGAPTSGGVGDVVALSASSSSGLPVAYAAEGGCSVSGTSLSLTRAGDCVVTATQAGDGDFTAAPSVRRTVAVSAAPVAAAPAVRDPTITATVTSRTPVSASGWYRSAVTVTFACTTGSAALEAACPEPVRIGRASTARVLTRTVTALDGGKATVTVGPLNVDRVAPKVSIVQRGGRAPVCRATDRRSGVASCTLRTITTARGVVLVAKAVDRAGNRAVRRVRVG